MVLFLLFNKVSIYFWGKCDKNTVAVLPEDEDTQKKKNGPKKQTFQREEER